MNDVNLFAYVSGSTTDTVLPSYRSDLRACSAHFTELYSCTYKGSAMQDSSIHKKQSSMHDAS